MKISFLFIQLHKSRQKLKEYYVHNRDMPCSYFFYRISFRFYGLDNFKAFYVIFTLLPCRVKIALVALWFYTVHKFISINLVILEVPVKLWMWWSCYMIWYYGITQLFHVIFDQTYWSEIFVKRGNNFNRTTPMSDLQPIFCLRTRT